MKQFHQENLIGFNHHFTGNTEGKYKRKVVMKLISKIPNGKNYTGQMIKFLFSIKTLQTEKCGETEKKLRD